MNVENPAGVQGGSSRHKGQQGRKTDLWVVEGDVAERTGTGTL